MDDATGFGQYHELAAEVQGGIAHMLNEVLQRYGIHEAALRQRVVTSFLFDFSAALDSRTPVTGLKDLVGWSPSLCFMQHGEDETDKPKAVLICSDTALHDSALDQAEAFYSTQLSD